MFEMVGKMGGKESPDLNTAVTHLLVDRIEETPKYKVYNPLAIVIIKRNF